MFLLAALTLFCGLATGEYVQKIKHPGCVDYKAIGPDEGSLLFAEASGRLGNHLLNYAFLYQLNISLGLETYTNDEAVQYMQKIFTNDSIRLPSIHQKFCNYDEIPFVFYYKHIRPLLTDKSYRTGQFYYLFPRTGEDGDFSTYRFQVALNSFFKSYSS